MIAEGLDGGHTPASPVARVPLLTARALAQRGPHLERLAARRARARGPAPPALLTSMPASSLHTLVALAAVADAFSPAAQTKPRHLVLIVADDLGYADLGYTGSEIRTPNIDGLANSGVDMFTELQPPYVRGTRTSRLRALRTRGAGQLASCASGTVIGRAPEAIRRRRYTAYRVPPRRTTG